MVPKNRSKSKTLPYNCTDIYPDLSHDANSDVVLAAIRRSCGMYIRIMAINSAVRHSIVSPGTRPVRLSPRRD
jgi:hypothetical protein